MVVQGFGCGTISWLVAKNLKKKEGSFTSLNVALVPDCGDNCIEVYGRSVQIHTKTRRATPDEETVHKIKERTSTFFPHIISPIIL